MAADHVIFNSNRGSFVCEHCGASYTPALPIPISMFSALTREFLKLHRGCPSPNKKKEASHERADHP